MVVIIGDIDGAYNRFFLTARDITSIGLHNLDANAILAWLAGSILREFDLTRWIKSD